MGDTVRVSREDPAPLLRARRFRSAHETRNVRRASMHSFAALHESGNGMARPRSAANLLDCGWEA